MIYMYAFLKIQSKKKIMFYTEMVSSKTAAKEVYSEIS